MSDNVIRQMTKNEYQEYLVKLASRLHTDAGYSIQDFQKDAESVNVLGFELDKFNLSDEERQVLNKMFDSERLDNQGNLLLCGHILSAAL